MTEEEALRIYNNMHPLFRSRVKTRTIGSAYRAMRRLNIPDTNLPAVRVALTAAFIVAVAAERRGDPMPEPASRNPQHGSHSR